MRRRIRSLTLAAIIPALITACSGAQKADVKTDAAKADKAADEQALKNMSMRWMDAIKTKNADAMASDFADDGMELFANAPAAKGPDAVKKAFSDLFGSLKNLEISQSDVVATVSDSGDLGILRFAYQMSYTDPKGKKVTDHGTSLTVLKKVNGQWKVLYDTNASEVASPQ